MAIDHTDVTAEPELAELVACTLSDTDLKSQRDRWINVGTNFGIDREKTKDGLRLTFENHPAVEQELRALVAVENECCGWASWSVERSNGGVLVMAARSKGEGVAALHGMFREAMPSVRGCGDC
jgi:hypothetical protein